MARASHELFLIRYQFVLLFSQFLLARTVLSSSFSLLNLIDDSKIYDLDGDSDFNEVPIENDINVLKLSSEMTSHYKELPKLIKNSSWIFMISMEGNVSELQETISLENILHEIDRDLLINFHNTTTEINYILRKHQLEILLLNSDDGNVNECKIVFELVMELKNISKSEYENLIFHSMNNSCTIALRLAQLIDNNFLKKLTLYENKIQHLKCDKSCFRDLLNLPITSDFLQVSIEMSSFLHENFTTQLADARTRALKFGQNFTTQKFLNETNARMNLEGLSALAWAQREFQVFEFLIRADCPYPENYRKANDKPDDNEYLQKLNNYIGEINEFHQSIREGRLDKVQNFKEKNENLIFARNTDNKSALQVAFESGQYKIYSYLLTHGFKLSDAREMAEHYLQRSRLDGIKKKKIRYLNKKHFIPAIEADPIEKLMQFSTVNFDHRKLSKDEVESVLRQAFQDIYEIVPELVKVIAACDHFEMIFDFDNAVVDELDPVQFNNAGSAFWNRDYIMMAGQELLSDKKYERDFALGTITHEIMHSVMGFMYDNQMHPYSLGDNESLQQMQLVVNECRARQNESTIMKSAFTSDYEEKLHDELIARTPDMIVNYRNRHSKLQKRKKIYKLLFDYYEDKIMVDLKKIQSTMPARIRMQEFNKWLGLTTELRHYQAKKMHNFTDEQLSFENDKKVQIFITNHTHSLLRRLYEKTMKNFELAVFLRSSFTAHEYFHEAMYEIDRVKAEVLLVIYCDSHLSKLKDLKESLGVTTFERVIIIGNATIQNEILGADFENYCVKNV